MTAPEWALPMVERALADKAVGGETITEAALQEEVGIGHDDLRATLDALREEGKAVEEAPGEWRAPYEDEEQIEAGEPAAERASSADLPSTALSAPRADSRLARAGEVTTVLTAGMAKSLGADALGQFIHAGIEDASGRPFVLRVEP